jgi:hypothetical protein
MGQPRLKWGQVERYLLRQGYEIRPAGGDKIIIAPRDGRQRSRYVVRIGHTSCDHPGTELLRCYVSRLHHVFGITIADVMRER